MPGTFTKRIRQLQNIQKKMDDLVMKPTKKGFRIPGHEKLRKKCKKCGKTHTINEHRFHGDNAHLRTHGEPITDIKLFQKRSRPR